MIPGLRQRFRGGPSGPRRVRVAVLALVAAIVVLLLDSTGGSHSPLSPIRSAIGTAAGPIESVANAVASPIADLGGYFHSNSSLRSDIDRLEAENARLKGQAALTEVQKARIAQVDRLTAMAKGTGYTLLAAHVIAVGPAQSFTQTVTLDAGSSSGLHADLTVVDSGGLVGRIVSVTSTTATVLLVTDPTSVVGAKVGANSRLGTAKGTSGSTLAFTFSGPGSSVKVGQTLTTWGSPNGVPYVAGIPIGTVTSATSNPRELSISATVTPFAQMGALDIVGVVVPAGAAGARPLISGVN